jgi:uncharacterized cofD-like protein
MIVSIGGGSGQSAILSSIKGLDYIVAIVGITDNGGSSGKIKNDFKIPPPGDIRNCIIALAEEQEIMGNLMQYRFNRGFLNNHTVGNILIAGLAEVYGDFSMAVAAISKILKINGKVLPVYPDMLTLGAVFEDGKTIWGETEIHEYGKKRKIKNLFINKDVYAENSVIEHIKNASLIIIGPGSLYTSILTNFLIGGIKESIIESNAKVVYIQNIFTEFGETNKLSVLGHLNELNKYFPINRIDYILLNNGKPPEEILERYAHVRENLVKDDLNNINDFRIIRDNFIFISNNVVRHSPIKIKKWIEKILNDEI